MVVACQRHVRNVNRVSCGYNLTRAATPMSGNCFTSTLAWRSKNIAG